MIQDASSPGAQELQLNEVLLAYVEAVEAGQPPDRARLLAEHPELAEQLRDFFACHDQVSSLASKLRDPARQPIAASPEPIGELGDFRLLREIGRGGMGIVYEAEQISLHRRVALKMLPFAAALDPRQLQRFRIEAQAAAQLHHTNIVPVFAVGSERGVHYYAMQYIEGQSLAALIDDLRRPVQVDPAATTSSPLAAAMSTARSNRPREFHAGIVRLARQAAEALEHAHQMGIVHRDIKPANLLLDERGQLWVTDFGLAQFRNDTELTATGEVLGTLRYASPEQTRARPGVVDQRSDIYALGATLYELLTLHRVFEGHDRAELLQQIAFDEPIAPRNHDRSIAVELETIVLKALAKAPGDRYGSAREMAEDLQRFLDDKPILARRPSLAERAAKWSRRHRPMVFAAVLLLGMGVVVLAVSTLLIARAYAGERLKAEEARKAQIRAEESFQGAKRAVDLLTQLSEEELDGIPPLQGVRRTMLDAALTYYQEFLDQASDDPAGRPELAVSHARVTRLLAELSALQGHAQMMWLNNQDVQWDLDAKPDQKLQIRKLGEKFTKEWGRISATLNKQDRQTKLAELAREHEKALAAVLSARQLKRLHQIGLQMRNQPPFCFREADIVAELKLSSKQQQEIRRIQEEAMPIWGLPPDGGKGPPGGGKGPPGGGKKGPPGKFEKGPPPEGPGHHSRDLLEKTQQRVLAVLTAEQLAQWRELTGEPFLCAPKGPGFGKGPNW